MSSTLRGLTAATAALSATALAVLTLAGPAVAADPPGDEPGAVCDLETWTCRQEFTPGVRGPRPFVVPNGVSSVVVEVAGSAGEPSAAHAPGAGGALRTVVDVTAGERLSVQTPKSSMTSEYFLSYASRQEQRRVYFLQSGGDLAAVFRGTGATATPLVVVGGGGAAGSAGDGGAGGGWDADPAQLLQGRPGGGPGAGAAATTTAPGGLPAEGTDPRGVAGTGPLTEPGTRGFGGWSTDLDAGVPAADGGHGWFGGGPGGLVDQRRIGGGGGGSGYLAPGLVAQQPSAAAVEAAQDSGRVVLEWERPLVLEPVLQYADGTPVEGELTSRELVVAASELPPGACVSVVAEPYRAYTRWADVEADGTVRVPYTLAYQEHTEPVRVVVELHRDGALAATAHLDAAVPPLQTATELTVPETVTAGERFTAQVARTGTQFGEATRGLPPVAVWGQLTSGNVRVLLDGEVVDPWRLRLPLPWTLDWKGGVPLTLTAPTGFGEHTLELQVGPNPFGLESVTRTFVVPDPNAPQPTASPVPTATPAAGAPQPTPTATERAEVLAADGSGGVLASTGAQVTAIGLAAAALIGAGAVLHRTRGRRTVRGRRAA